MSAPLAYSRPNSGSVDPSLRKWESSTPAGDESISQARPTLHVPDGFVELTLARPATLPVLALGAELKSSVCLYAGRSAFIHDRLGNLTDPVSYRQYANAIDRLLSTTGIRPRILAHDLHPLYISSQYAQGSTVKRVAVQHHHAHVAAVAADCGVSGPMVGVCCDGVGMGTDGAAWGCEVLLCDGGRFRRFGHLDYFHLIGGDAAAVENWRPAAALLYQVFGNNWRAHLPASFSELSGESLSVADRTFSRKLDTHWTSSLGRVFDGVSFLLGLSQRNDASSVAAVALERAAVADAVAPYPYETTMIGGCVRMSMTSITRAVMRDIQAGATAGVISARFHETIARMLAASATLACAFGRCSRVVLAGGCFVNKILKSRVTERLSAQRLQVLTPLRVSLGDENIALGQAVVAAAMENEVQ